MSKLTHIDKHGKAKMVDVTAKEITTREAVAKGNVFMQPYTLKSIMANEVKKGDVLGVAKIAGIMAAKKAGDIIPLCHPLSVTSVDISFEPIQENVEQGNRVGVKTATRLPRSKIDITATAKVAGRTGVEMEALTAVSVAALTVYDMCKAIDKGMTISDIRLVKKKGGKSGTYIRDRDA